MIPLVTCNMSIVPNRLMQQEEEWKMDVEATLAMKDARTRMLQMEKEEMIQEVTYICLYLPVKHYI